MTDRVRASVQEAIKSISTGKYAGKYQKVELEAVLHRGSRRSNEPQQITCSSCRGSTRQECECELNGLPEGVITCSACHDEGYTDCTNEACSGGMMPNPAYRQAGNWGDNEVCHAFIKKHVSAVCRKHTVFSRFYHDGSVDSEFTFTVPIGMPELVLEYIEAFKALGKAISSKPIDTRGAGMHITILRTPKGGFPFDGVDEDRYSGEFRRAAESTSLNLKATYHRNFKKSMTKLLPALLLLASSDHRSRPLNYRRPIIESGHRGAIAIAGNGNCYEFRIFETCYDRPEMYYDYLCTIANALKFYRYTSTNIPISVGELEFYDDRTNGLHRYYHTEKHLEALDKGLPYLMPDYRTVEDCKKIRNFTLKTRTIENRKIRVLRKLEGEWDSYKDNRSRLWDREKELHARTKASWKADGYSSHDLAIYSKADLENRRKKFELNNPKNKAAWIKKRLAVALTPAAGNPSCQKYLVTI